MSDRDVFEQLVDNALDFFEKSIDEFDTYPKFSLLHFCVGFELILKSRLAYEHWALIARELKSIQSINHMKEGKVVTIGYEEAIQRISSLLSEDLKIPEKMKIKKLFETRNKVVHFSGGDFEQDGKTQIISNQLISWYIIYHDFIMGPWTSIYAPFLERISNLNKNLKNKKQYLEISYQHIREIIEDKKNIGTIFTTCPVCKYESYETHYFEDLEFHECLTCGFDDFYYILCPSCESAIPLFKSKEITLCKRCNSKILTEEIIDAFKKNNPLSKDNYSDGFPIAHCRSCGSNECVIMIKDDSWICLKCFTRFQDNEIKYCCHCNERNAGDLDESSNLNGCNACFGNEG